MKAQKILLAVLILFLLALPAFSHQFILKNGQIIEGALIHYYQNAFEIQKTAGGIVTVKLDDLASINFERAKITISILKNYLGQTVTLNGQFMGWLAEAGSPPVTRSDWVLKDETGLIYVTGKIPGLYSNKDKGKALEITGLVKITPAGKIYLEGKKVSVISLEVK